VEAGEGNSSAISSMGEVICHPKKNKALFTPGGGKRLCGSFKNSKGGEKQGSLI